MTKKKMGGIGKLSQLSGIKKEPVAVSASSTPSEAKTKLESQSKPEVLAKVEKIALDTDKNEKLVTVNIKITKTQKDWLAETAGTVRNNNLEPVPPSERVYPQHLIGIAIDLLRSSEVDWQGVKNVEELREQLNL